MFTPTQKQLQAIANIEKFIWIWSNKISFENRDDFQSYFDLLSKKAKKKAKLLDDVESWNTTWKEINNAKKEKLSKFYSDSSNLRNFAINYINKYFPTKAKLLEKMHLKTSNIDVIENVFDDVKTFINEEKMINNLIDLYKSAWKNIAYIKTKLIQKKFEKELISKTIKCLEETESFLDEFKIAKRIETLKNKWKSIQYIKQKFIEREVILKEIEKLKAKWFEKQKIIEKLLTKWFKYSELKKCF